MFVNFSEIAVKGPSAFDQREHDGEETRRNPAPATILIVENHPLTASGLQSLVQGMEDCRLSGVAWTAEEARRIAKAEQPDVITLDLRIGGSAAAGIQLARDFRTVSPYSRILVCSAFVSEGDVKTLADIGIDGYVIKSEPLSVIAGAIRALAGGQTFYSRPVSQIMHRVLRSRTQDQSAACPLLGSDELETLRLVADGLTSDAIARRLSVSRSTVTRRLAAVFQVLNVSTRAEAVGKAVQLGYLDAGSGL